MTQFPGTLDHPGNVSLVSMTTYAVPVMLRGIKSCHKAYPLKATCAVIHFPWTPSGPLEAASPACGAPGVLGMG